MTTRVYRSKLIYVAEVAGLLLLVWWAFFSIADREPSWGIFTRYILLPLGVLQFIWLIYHPGYIEFDDVKLTIYSELFEIDMINLADIDHVELSETPFSRSYFVMKNTAKHPFTYFSMSDASFKEFTEKIGKPIVHA